MELVFRKLKECKGKPFDIQVRLPLLGVSSSSRNFLRDDILGQPSGFCALREGRFSFVLRLVDHNRETKPHTGRF